MKAAIIMAAGKGTRMRSEMPKTMHKVLDKPIIEHLVDTLNQMGIDKVISVVGYGKEAIMDYLKDKCEYAVQEPQLGTGHAVMQVRQLESEKGYTLVINGDCPLVREETLALLLEEAKEASMVVLTSNEEDPAQYGRVIRRADGTVEKIVEYKDCNENEVNVREINTGIYAFHNEDLFEGLKKIKNDNKQQEYYITDLVEIFNLAGKKVKAVIVKDGEETAGINDRFELLRATKTLQKRNNLKLMEQGVTLLDMESTYIGSDVTIGRDTIVYPNNYIFGKTSIGKDNVILSGCYIENSTIGNHNYIDNSRITDSIIHNEVRLGPWAHLRNGCEIEDSNRIGNFVEMKNTKVGEDSRCAHLTYLGDTTVGKKVNFGCGVVTVNYDGKDKFETIIGDNSFVGSNVNLIAPVKIGNNVVLAAGSTINEDVEDGAMAIARGRQTNKEGYGLKYLNKERK
jgi:UDP-N-acetylglucosamine diphosphorylase/glucosamine-1-phosphate N-acetyltransferase